MKSKPIEVMFWWSNHDKWDPVISCSKKVKAVMPVNMKRAWLRFVFEACRKLAIKSEADNELKALCYEARKIVTVCVLKVWETMKMRRNENSIKTKRRKVGRKQKSGNCIQSQPQCQVCHFSLVQQCPATYGRLLWIMIF